MMTDAPSEALPRTHHDPWWVLLRPHFIGMETEAPLPECRQAGFRAQLGGGESLMGVSVTHDSTAVYQEIAQNVGTEERD